jgi:4-diphosphocytidyl-2-C-methyl-D-erythritol kinase
MNCLAVFSPAKINLFFAVTGLRGDGYHSVLSANVALDFGDEITIRPSTTGRDEFNCDCATLDLHRNTIVEALNCFRTASGSGRYFSIFLKKNIAMGTGFGGGSSNATAVLKAVNGMCGGVICAEKLKKLCASVGADCPFFMASGPSLVGGIGDVCEPLDGETVSALANYEVLIFWPNFAVSTAAAYGDLKKNGRQYISEPEAIGRFDALRRAIVASEISLPLFNTFSATFFQKHPQMRNLCAEIGRSGANAMLTGSGSGFFCIANRSIGCGRVERIVKSHGMFTKKTSMILR